VGFKFVSCENKIITVEYHNTRKVFELLRLIEFDSDRKRMSVVVRAEQSICVFVKGADTNI
jgi:phospholipid-translocating ATPase